MNTLVGSIHADWDEERTARACLSGVVDPAAKALRATLAAAGAPAVWQALRDSPEDSVWARRAKAFNLDRSLSLANHDDLRFLIPGDPGWPPTWEVLEGIDKGGLGGMPLGVWLVGPGDPAYLLDRGITVVGSRAATHYGTQIGTMFGADLAELGWTVVSGGAYGVDASAHRGALSVDGASVAVLAGGLDEWYPRGNARLLDHLAATGLVISEVAPGIRPHKKAFLSRNRLLAAGSRVTVLIEAAPRSGALNTVGWALGMGRPLMAVPGPITSALSQGPNDLLHEGKATAVTCVAQVVKDLEFGPDEPHQPAQPTLLDLLEEDELAAREALPGRGSRSVHDVAERSGLTVPDVIGALASLEVQGLARRMPDGGWALARPGSP